jgi:hypothetical protein
MAESGDTMPATSDDAASEEAEKRPPSLPPRPPSFSLSNSQPVSAAAASSDVAINVEETDSTAASTVQTEAEDAVPSAGDAPAAIVLEAPDSGEAVRSPVRSSMPFGHDTGEPTEEEIEKMR